MPSENVQSAIELLENKIDLIQNNHLAHLTMDVQELTKKFDAFIIQMTDVKSDTKWLMRIGGFLAAAMIPLSIALFIKK